MNQLASENENNKFLGVLQFFTGIASSAQSQHFNSVGHLLQSAVSGSFCETLKHEFNYYIDKGKIKKDYFNSDQSQMCFIELLRFLEQELPDKDRLELLKKIYIVASTEEKSDLTSPLPLQLMQIARGLTPGEILVIFAAFRNGGKSVKIQDEYIELLTQESGLQFKELTKKHFEILKEKDLLKKIELNTASNSPILIRDYLMTPLGRYFCEYISHYETITVNE